MARAFIVLGELPTGLTLRVFNMDSRHFNYGSCEAYIADRYADQEGYDNERIVRLPRNKRLSPFGEILNRLHRR